PEPLPPPITTPADLAARIDGGRLGWAWTERVLAALAELTWRDADGVRAALAPVVERRFTPRMDGERRWAWVDHWLLAVGRRLTGSVPLPPGWRDRLPSPGEVVGPHLLYLSRCAELVAAAEHGAMPPLLLATPTEPTGHLDPAVFVDRLEALQNAGADPGPADLQQALLRLPRDIGPETAGRAAALTSPAGRTAARWLAAGGLPVPDVSMRPFEGGVPEAVISAPPTGLLLVDEVFTAPSRHIGWKYGRYEPVWPRLLPSHPDVAIAHVLPQLRPATSPVGNGASVARFVEVTRGDGPFAEAIGHFLARALAPRRHAEADRALLTMAARGDLPAAELGRHIGRLARAGEIQPVRIIEALERAAEAGAYAQVWDVIAAALPVLCPEPGERPVHGLKRLIALGLRTARWSGAHGPIPELEELASRKASSDLVREARALATHLSAHREAENAAPG
ncbi:DUF6493 family protein, partial [Actinomadura sp. KC216]|uniref:DUF7824 domain-containing protein n=1 Tax=Actinomadura sp. KC216 TaxID=2530370 RepID=UPI001A9D7491